MATQLGTGHIEGFGTAVLTQKDSSGADIAGYISPNLQSLRVSHNAGAVNEIKSQGGLVTGLLINDEMIECTFDFIPEGTTVANAKTSARLPEIGTRVKTANLPVVVMGTFTDALNADATNPWIYLGGGSLNMVNDNVASATLPLKRFKNIASAAQIS